jgi:hypothetical protein
LYTMLRGSILPLESENVQEVVSILSIACDVMAISR